MRPDDEGPWWRPVLTGLAALLGVSLLVGAVVGAVALGAAKVVGLDGSDSARPSQSPSLFLPALSPTASPQPTDETPASPESPKASDTPSTKAEPKPKRKPKARVIRLSASPMNVRPSERINLTGTYHGGDGATLQVQRFESGWSDFPVTATVRGDTFATYVLTGRSGANRFRVYDAAAGRASNPVTVTVG
jgi:hypothetical protein